MIPNRIIFIWLGENFPWSGGIALRSAWKVQQPESIWLVHEGMKNTGEGFELIRDIPNLKIIPVQDSFFDGLNDNGCCLQLFRALKSPASRANILRLALLYKYGGVYLDTDTVAVRPWNDLLEMKGFCGVEPVALPRELFKSLNPFKWIICGFQFAFREFCARLPGGYKAFRILEHKFTPAVNNAVIGVEAGNELIKQAFKAIQDMPLEERTKHFRLGTHLMQSLTRNTSSKSMSVLPSAFFYPLGPEISAHWFKNDTAGKLNDLLLADTRIVHWYNSVEKRFLKTHLSSKWLRDHSDTAFAEMIQNLVVKIQH